MNLVKVLSTRVVEARGRLVKYLRYGKSDVQESREASSFGIDSNSPKDTIAVYAPTSEKGKAVIVGYLNKNQLAEYGETRLFSVDVNGDLSAFVWLKNNGDLQLMGDSDFAIRYSEMETAFNELRDKVNDLISKYNSHTHITTATVGGSPTPGIISPTTSTEVPTTVDMTAAKIDEIKVP